MGAHSGRRVTANKKAFVPANLYDVEITTGKIADSVELGDIIYKIPQGFTQSIETISPSSHGFGYEIAFCEHEGEYYMAQAIGIVPFVVTYKLNSDTWEYLDPPDNQIASTGVGVALQSFQGILYLAVAHTNIPRVTIFYRAGNEWQAVGNLSSPPAGDGRGASFCVFNNSLYLMVAHSTTPFVSSYVKDANSENWTKLNNPNTLPASTGNGASSVVYNGNMFMAIAHNNSPFVRSYRFNQTTSGWEVINNPPTLPASTGNGVKLKVLDNEMYMSVAHSSSPFVRHYVYNESTNTWSNLAIVSGTNIPPTTAFKTVLFESNGSIYSSTAHNNEPFITTSKLVSGSWVKLDDPNPIAEHNLTTSTVQSYYLEMIEIDGYNYMGLSLQFQPFLKAYTWDPVNEVWTDEHITNLFPAPSGTVFNPEAIVFKDVLYMGFAHAITPFMSIYKRVANTEFRLMKRPVTLPASTGSGCKFAIYEDKLYFCVAHTNSPRFRMYVLDEATELWDPIEPPIAGDLPTGNGVETSIRAYDGKLYVSVAHATTPFITTYTWTELDGWTQLDTPTTLPGANATDAAMKVYDDVLHLSVTSVATTQAMVVSYIFDKIENKWVFVDRNVNISTSSGAGANGVDYEEWDNDFYMSISHNLSPFNRILKWNSDTGSWVNQSNFLPTIKSANTTRNTLYNDNGTLYFAIVSLDGPNFGRISIHRRLNDTWISYYHKDVVGNIPYGLRFIKFNNRLWLMVGIQLAPYYRLFLLSDNDIKDVWSKQPLEYYDRVGIAKEKGEVNDEIEIYITKR